MNNQQRRALSSAKALQDEMDALGAGRPEKAPKATREAAVIEAARAYVKSTDVFIEWITAPSTSNGDDWQTEYERHQKAVIAKRQALFDAVHALNG